MDALILCILGLFLGPILFILFKNNLRLFSFIDGFNLVTITILVFSILIPEFAKSSDWMLILFVLLGLLLPGFLEHQFHKFHNQIHIFIFIITVIGLLLHAFLDGAAISPLMQKAGGFSSVLNSLSIAVILHQIPVGLAIWGVLAQNFQFKTAFIFIIAMVAFTSIGFFLGKEPSHGDENIIMNYLQMFVLGSLLHVIIHKSSVSILEKKIEFENIYLKSKNIYEGFGAIFALITVFAFLHFNIISFSNQYFEKVFSMFVAFFMESSFALFIGFLFAGLIAFFMPNSFIGFLKKGGIIKQSFKGVIIGLPIPVCSCGVVPIYKSLIDKGVPISGAIAFLIATPEFGLDAVFLSIPLLGTQVTLVRIIVAFFVAIIVSIIVGYFSKFPQEKIIFKKRNKPVQFSIEKNKVKSNLKKDTCCEKKTLDHQHIHHHHSTNFLMEDNTKLSFSTKIKKSLHYSFIEAVDHNGPWIFMGIVVAALLEPILSLNLLSFQSSFISVPIMALIGIPLYICASGATPLAAVLLMHDFSLGSVIALLISGPATNVSTFGLLKSLHGKKITLLFAITIFLVTVIIGYLLDYFFTFKLPSKKDFFHMEEKSLYQIIFTVLMGIIFLFSFVKRGPRIFFKELKSSQNSLQDDQKNHHHH